MIPIEKIVDGLRVTVDLSAFRNIRFRDKLLRDCPELATTIFEVRIACGEICLKGLGSARFNDYLLNYADSVQSFLSRESANGRWSVLRKESK